MYQASAISTIIHFSFKLHRFCYNYAWLHYFRFSGAYEWVLISAVLVWKHLSAIEGKRRPSENDDTDIHVHILMGYYRSQCIFSWPMDLFRHSTITWPFTEVSKRPQPWWPAVNAAWITTLLSSLAAVVKLNFAFYNSTTACMCRKQAIIQTTCN